MLLLYAHSLEIILMNHMKLMNNTFPDLPNHWMIFCNKTVSGNMNKDGVKGIIQLYVIMIEMLWQKLHKGKSCMGNRRNNMTLYSPIGMMCGTTKHKLLVYTIKQPCNVGLSFLISDFALYFDGKDCRLEYLVIYELNKMIYTFCGRKSKWYHLVENNTVTMETKSYFDTSNFTVAYQIFDSEILSRFYKCDIFSNITDHTKLQIINNCYKDIHSVSENSFLNVFTRRKALEKFVNKATFVKMLYSLYIQERKVIIYNLRAQKHQHLLWNVNRRETGAFNIRGLLNVLDGRITS